LFQAADKVIVCWVWILWLACGKTYHSLPECLVVKGNDNGKKPCGANGVKYSERWPVCPPAAAGTAALRARESKRQN
jgi:hypothetical protein